MAWASSAPAGVWYNKYASRLTYIGSAPDSFQIGTLPAYWTFVYNTDDNYGDWRFGYSITDGGAQANKCGWVNVNDLMPNPDYNFSSPCTAGHKSTTLGVGSRQFLRSLYACAVNDYVPSGGVTPFFLNTTTGTYEVNQTGQVINVYGNYNYNTYAMVNPYVGQIGPGSQFNWRWVSDNSGVILGKIPYGNWGFVPRGVLRGDLMYADNNRRWDSWAGG